MIAYNIPRELVAAVRAGSATATIRLSSRLSKKRPTAGEALVLERDFGRPQRRVMGRARISSVAPISLAVDSARIDGRTVDDLSTLAARCGFPSYAALARFYGVASTTPDCFTGLLIAWSGFEAHVA